MTKQKKKDCFKIGDTVIGKFYNIDIIGKILEINNGIYKVHSNGLNYGFKKEDLESVSKNN